MPGTHSPRLLHVSFACSHALSGQRCAQSEPVWLESHTHNPLPVCPSPQTPCPVQMAPWKKPGHALSHLTPKKPSAHSVQTSPVQFPVTDDVKQLHRPVPLMPSSQRPLALHTFPLNSGHRRVQDGE